MNNQKIITEEEIIRNIDNTKESITILEEKCKSLKKDCASFNEYIDTIKENWNTISGQDITKKTNNHLKELEKTINSIIKDIDDYDNIISYEKITNIGEINNGE